MNSYSKAPFQISVIYSFEAFLHLTMLKANQENYPHIQCLHVPPKELWNTGKTVLTVIRLLLLIANKDSHLWKSSAFPLPQQNLTDKKSMKTLKQENSSTTSVFMMTVIAESSTTI